jgi:OFA family oxalate/formate antiporter-like MFS transporter
MAAVYERVFFPGGSDLAGGFLFGEVYDDTTGRPLAGVPVSLFGLQMAALTLAISLDRVFDGFGRPFFGYVSDNIGREQTMFIAFAIEAVGILALYQFGRDPIAFVILTGIVFFAWGEIYSLFPSTCADTFGSKYAAANAGMLYTAKGTASLLVPLSSVLATATGSWHAVFIAASVLNATAALMAWFVLKPMRRAQMNQSVAEAGRPASNDMSGAKAAGMAG